MNLENNPKTNDQIFETWFRSHYLSLILGFLFIFLCLPVLAPVLFKSGIILPAKVIYWIYGFFCHQLPFRSWFLFGAQPFYPLASAGVANIITFEEFFHPETMDTETIRLLVGNLNAGYKLAICQRDIAMYASLLTFGIVFAFINRKIKRIPLWIWIVFGVVPIGLDGLWQYFGNFPLPLLREIARESTPFLRTITGSLFGILTGWYIFPTLDSIINRDFNKIAEL